MRLHSGDGVENVVGGQSDVLHAGALVEVEILFDLRLAASFGRLVDGELHVAVAVGHHLRHQRRVFRGDVFVVEVLVELEAHHVGVKLDPLIHGMPANVTHHVIDVLEAGGPGDGVVGSARYPGRKGPL